MFVLAHVFSLSAIFLSAVSFPSFPLLLSFPFLPTFFLYSLDFYNFSNQVCNSRVRVRDRAKDIQTICTRLKTTCSPPLATLVSPCNPLLQCVMPRFTPFGHLFLLLVLSNCYCHFINGCTLLSFIFYPFYKLLSYEIRFVYSIPSLTSQPSLQSLVSSRIQILASTMTLSKSTSLLILIILNFRLVWSNSFVWCDAI